jgi:hypothetical protein
LLPTEGDATPGQAYVFLVLAYPEHPENELSGGYEQYRQARAAMLQAYCIVLLGMYRQVHTVVGIALDAKWTMKGRKGGSEELMAVSVDEWTDEMVANAAEAQEHYDIYRQHKMTYTDFHATNYPDIAGRTSMQKQRLRHRKKNNPFRQPKDK